MNIEIAHLLKEKILNLPFVDVVAGLVQVVEVANYSDDDNKLIAYRRKFPVSYDVTGLDSCTGTQKDLQPDSYRKSIIYFEDFGTRVTASQNGLTDFTSQLRLVCWLNKDRLTGDQYSFITSFCVSAIIGKICRPNPENIGNFQMLKSKALQVPVQGPNLFSNYTYDETVRQYLMPPYEAFGIDFSCTYKVANNCVASINFNNPTTC